MKGNSGISIIFLIILVVIVGIVIVFGLQYAKRYVENQEQEDIKATMLAIQSVITNIENKHIVDEENNSLVGTKLVLEKEEPENSEEEIDEENEEDAEDEEKPEEDDEEDQDTEKPDIEYKISDKLKEQLLSLEESELYILNKEELEQYGVKDVEITDTKFFVVDYISEEVFYSLGIDGKYKLSEM